MRTDVAIDKLIDIAPVIYAVKEKLSNDDKFAVFMRDFKANGGGDNIDFTLKFIPHLLKVCKEEVYQILAIINDVSEDELKAQSIIKTINQIKDLIKDEDIRSFFSSVITTDEG